MQSCTEKAMTRSQHVDGIFEYVSDAKKCIGCGSSAGICPCDIWTLKNNPEEIKMYRTKAE